MHSHLALRLALLPRAERGLLLAHALGDKELFFLREGSAVDPPRGGLGSRRCGRRRRRSWRCRCRLFGDDDSIGRGRERRSSVGDCFSGACCCSLFFGHVVLDGWDGFSRGGFFDGASWRRAGGVQHWSPLFLSFFFQIRISKHFRPKGSESSQSTLDGKKKKKNHVDTDDDDSIEPHQRRRLDGVALRRASLHLFPLLQDPGRLLGLCALAQREAARGRGRGSGRDPAACHQRMVARRKVLQHDDSVPGARRGA